MVKKYAKKITAVLTAVTIIFSMLLYFPSGTISNISFGLTASAAEITNDLTLSAVTGDPKGYTNEGYANLFDGDTGTKWCCNFSTSAYVIFKASEPVMVSKYSIATANDTVDNPGRNPVEWTLSGCMNYADANTSWTVIDTVTEGGLPTENEAYADFDLAETTPFYQYFKLEITNIKSGDILQISEIALEYTLCEHQWKATGETIAPTCTEVGYNVEYCPKCKGKRNVPTVDALGHNFVDGACTRCGLADTTPKEPSTNVNGVYQIGTAGELYWFAGLVNGTLEEVDQNTAANAVLTADITVNTGVLKSDGTLADDTSGFTSWTPIGNIDNMYANMYAGTFDGQNHTISGLYCNISTGSAGLFGYSRGTVKNVGVVDSYFSGNTRVGGVCGRNENGTITNCYNSGEVSGEYYVGGVCGVNNAGNIIDCYNTGAVSGEYYVGGVCGGCNYSDFLSTGTITNCYYDSNKYSGNAVGCDDEGTVTDVEGKTTAQFNSGEVAYLLSQGTGGSIWGQEIGTDPYPVLNGKKVLANVDCSAFANDIIVYGQSASLDGTIGFNIYVSADDSYEWDKTVNGVQGVEIENGLYKFTYQVAAKDMDKKINFTVDDKIDVTVCVSDYLAVISETDNAFLKNLADSMSVYGDAAKAYFSGEAVAEQTVTDDLSVYDFTLGTMPEGISYYGSSLILKSETTIRHYFKLAEGKEISDYTFSVDGMTVTPTEKQGYYCIDIKNVRAEKLGTSFNVSVNGEEVITNYSALSYVYKVMDSDSIDDNLKNLVKALYLYNLATVTYNVKTGWVQYGENRYYYDDGIMQTGWVNDIPGFEGAWFYFGDDGIMQTGWANDIPGFDDAWFYFGDDGIMQTGWVTNIPEFDGAWFYFGDDGIMQTGWATDIPGFEGARFYFGDDGIMQTSRWVLDGGNLYYLNDDGSMHTGWLQLGENWYYLNDDGTLLRNGYTPDGYYVDESGMWTGI